MPGAAIVLSSLRTGERLETSTDPEGRASFTQLVAGDYSIDVSKAGLATLRVERVVVGVRDWQILRLQLTKVTAQSTSVTVTDTLDGVSTDPSSSTPLDQRYFQNLPVNGRNAESLILMAPGITSAAGGRGGVGGGFNANGLRSNTNYFTLDGVSLNQSVGGGPGAGGPGPGGGGPPTGGPASGGSGISSDIGVIDGLEELRVQTSAFAPEFGRSPGAQVVMTSRGGSGIFHGSLFYYFRNEQMAANDWFANSRSFPRGKMRQNRPGGTLGGPIIANRTFFFVTYEGLRLTTPSTAIVNVPDLNSRRAAAPALRPYLNAFPVPNGPATGTGAAEYHAVVSNPSQSDSGSLRLDHTLAAGQALFARFAVARSSAESRGSDFSIPNVVTDSRNRSETGTGGWTSALSGSRLNELRVNYSRSSFERSPTMDSFGGATPLNAASVFPRGVDASTGQFSLNIAGLSGYSIGRQPANSQTQLNIVDTFTKNAGTHTFKLGIDYRRITPTNQRTPYSQGIFFNGLSGNTGLLSSNATNAQVSSNVTSVYPLYANFSAFAQDTWRYRDRTTVTYGLRWDVNPAPTTREGEKPFALSESTVAGVTQNDPLYETRFLNIAPRVGLAYQIDTTPGREMMFRSGFGVFYDLGYGSSAAAFNGAPFSSVRTISPAAFPLTAANAAAPALPPKRPYGQISAADRTLQSPMIFQWNMTLERAFGRGQLLSVAYAGTNGRRLLRSTTQPSFTDAYDLLRTATNGAKSSYHGLQVQFRKRLSASLHTQLSYSYSHSIDDASNDAGFGGFATLFGSERGSSDYDIRHNLNFSGSYRLPLPSKGLAGMILGGWYTDWVATWRTGLPFDVRGVTAQAGGTTATGRTGLFAQIRPDYNGKEVWLDDPTAPAGKRVNSAAFTLPTGFAQGNLGRNALRGLSARQLDLSLRRTIPIGERVQINLAAEGYNVFNIPNFADPSPLEGANLSSPSFGLLTRMLNQTFGGGSVNSLYRSGGPRSAELVFRVTF